MEQSVIIIGAGPAGLTAAYRLCQLGCRVTVLEADPRYVGGISRTEEHDGFRFDIGGHRFYSKSPEIEALWTELCEPEELITRQRSSRIYYRGKFFSYPLRPVEALCGLGLAESMRCGLSYVAARLRPHPEPANFEQWVSNQFGSRLYQIFFKTYTEKVWGMPCTEISADWAAQRIKGLNLYRALVSALFPHKRKGGQIKTLIDSFRYPRLGPGQLWEQCAEKVRAMGGEIHMGQRVAQLSYAADTQSWEVGTEAGQSHSGAHVISTAAIGDLAPMIEPAPSPTVREAAGALSYRDFITVAVMARADQSQPDLSDQWIYIHDPGVQVGRVQNYSAWSPDMVPGAGEMLCYGLEYFCFAREEGLWAMADADLERLAIDELVTLGLLERESVTGAKVVRQRKAYPVYDEHYSQHVATIREELARDYPSLHLVGRNGMHKYNNQDHSMMTALLCAENIAAGETKYDLWQINEDAAYGEAGEADHSVSGLRAVPTRVE